MRNGAEIMRNRKDITPVKTQKQLQKEKQLDPPPPPPHPPRFLKTKTRPALLPLMIVLLTIIIFTLTTIIIDWKYASSQTSKTIVATTTPTTTTIPISRTDAAVNNKSNIQQHQEQNQEHPIGAIVFLAPARYASTIWGIDRFCLLLRAIRSVDLHLNSKFGPYPIYVLIARDYEDYGRQQTHYLNRTTIPEQGPYTLKDRNLIQQWATNHTPVEMIQFIDFDLYTGDAIEPNTTYQEIYQWRLGSNGGIQGTSLGYQSMCRLWSGRIQSMEFLNKYKYYLRMDDDSLLLDDLEFDPFLKMERNNVTYAYRRDAYDHWGIDQLWNLSIPFLDFNEELPFVVDRDHGHDDDYLYGYEDNNNNNYGGDDDDTTTAINTRYQKDGHSYYYDGGQPYNNFHVTRIDFWRSTRWIRLWNIYNRNHIWFKYRVGDANVHAIAIMLMDPSQVQVWGDIPIVHNSNDYGSQWWQNVKIWGEECQQSYHQHLLL